MPMFIPFCRSVSLVGEKERKLLKEIVKLAKTPVKSRIVPTGEKEIDLYCCYLFSLLNLLIMMLLRTSRPTHSKMLSLK